MSNSAADYFDSQCEMANEAVSSTEWSKIKPRSNGESQIDSSDSLSVSPEHAETDNEASNEEPRNEDLGQADEPQTPPKAPSLKDEVSALPTISTDADCNAPNNESGSAVDNDGESRPTPPTNKGQKPKQTKKCMSHLSSSEEEAFLQHYKSELEANDIEVDQDDGPRVRINEVIFNDLKSLHQKGGVTRIINTLAMVFLIRYGKMLKKESRARETYIK